MKILKRIAKALIRPFLKNVRFGFATNSSSSHSMVYLRTPINSKYNPDEKPWKRLLEDEDGLTKYDKYDDEERFLTTIAEKLFYNFAAIASERNFDREEYSWTYEKSDDELKEILQKDYPEFAAEDYDEIITAARDYDNNSLSGNSCVDLNEARDPYVAVAISSENGPYPESASNPFIVDVAKQMNSHPQPSDYVYELNPNIEVRNDSWEY